MWRFLSTIMRFIFSGGGSFIVLQGVCKCRAPPRCSNRNVFHRGSRELPTGVRRHRPKATGCESSHLQRVC